MKVVPYVIGFLLCALPMNAQYVKIDYAGDPLSEKERGKIEDFLRYEVGFYARFGLPDTLKIKLTIFDRHEDGEAYIESLGLPSLLPLSRTSGAYIRQKGEAVLLGREKGKERSLSVIYHELSHHFTAQVTGNRPPSWLMEGLAEYFEHCEISKGKLKHSLTSYEKGRIKTMYMLGEINLKEFVDADRRLFMKKQRTDESYAYILAHAVTTFWVEDVPEELLKRLFESLRDKTDKSPVSVRIDRIYPGGLKKFEQDFARIYSGN